MISMLPLVVEMKEKFVRAPGFERVEETALPGEKSLTVIVEGVMAMLNTGVVTLVILPVLATVLYLTGFRIAGPIVGLLALGLFAARMFGAPA